MVKKDEKSLCIGSITTIESSKLDPYFKKTLVSNNIHSGKLTTNIAMENGPFEDVFPIETGDTPLLC